MGYRSPYSTPENTLSPPEVIDASTPWSEVFLEEHVALQLNTPQSLSDRLRNAFRTHSLSWNRTIWLAVVLAAGLLWSLLSGTKYVVSLPGSADVFNHQTNVEGLQFIDATHPYIRVGNIKR